MTTVAVRSRPVEKEPGARVASARLRAPVPSQPSAPVAGPSAGRPAPVPRPGFWDQPRGSASPLRELGLFALALALFPLVAAIAPGDAVSAIARGSALADAERSLGLLVEPAAHAWVAERPALMAAACLVYMLAHLPAVAGALVWVWLERPRSFPFARNVFLVAQALTVAGYLLLPTAPPRLVPGLGIADTLSQFWGSGSASAAHMLQSPYAALPSGHVVFALIAGAIVVSLARPWPIRALGVAYPLLVVAVTIVTGNHFWIDAVAGAAVTCVAAGAVGAASRLHGRRAPALPAWRRLASGEAGSFGR